MQKWERKFAVSESVSHALGEFHILQHFHQPTFSFAFDGSATCPCQHRAGGRR